MIEFVCTPLPVRIALGVTMLTMKFCKAQMCLFFRNVFSHSWGPKKPFGTNEKLSLGCKVGQIRFYGIGYPNPVLIEKLPTPEVFRCT